MQFTANNIDINDSLLGRKDTFHTTQVPGWQRGPNKTKHLASLRPTDRTALLIPEALCSNCWAANIVEDKSVPVCTEPIEQKWYTVFILLFGARHTFPKPVLPNPKKTGWALGWAQAGDLLIPAFMTLNSNSEASLAWFHFGVTLTAQLFSGKVEGHISCVLGSVDALRSTLNTASNVVIPL